MMRKLAAAVIAVSLIAGPALAQTPGSIGTSNTPATTGQPALKADAPKTGVKIVKRTRHHTVKMAKHVKHAKHSKHVKHVKRSAKTAG